MGARQPRPLRRAAIGTPIGPGTCAAWTSSRTSCPRGRRSRGWRPWPGSARSDTYGILEAFGRDCAGAIMVLPDGERPGGNDGSGYSPMTPGDLRRVISALDVARWAPRRSAASARRWPASSVRRCSAGRRWHLAVPYGDAPSTWILKPDGPHPMAANEATCLRLAAACGLAVPESGTARRRRASRAGGQALRPAGLARREPSGPGAPGGRLPGDRHAAGAEVRGTGRPGTARPRRVLGTSVIPVT